MAIGQPPKLTPEVAERIADAVRRGNTLRNAAALGGVSLDSMLEWCRRGRGEDDRPSAPIYADFAERIKKAKADAEDIAVGRVRDAAMSGTWQAACWWLERRRHKQWGRKDIVQHRHEAGKPGDISDAEYERLLREEMARLEAKKSA